MKASKILIGLALAALGATSIAAQAPAPAPRSIGATAGQGRPSTVKPAALRTSDGKADLQGIWTNATITPLERPQNMKNLVLSEEEAARMEKAVVDRRDRLSEPSDPNRTAPPQGGDGSTGAAGNVGGYNNFWLDPGERVAIVDGQRRSSLIIDPPDGRVPSLTPEARARQAARVKGMTGRGQYDHPEYRPLAERCLLSFGPTTPLVPNYFYNNNLQIVQTPDHVMILMEMVHDARVVRIGGKHVPPTIRSWMGDSIGWWEGDTLVVDTTNFTGKTQFNGSSDQLHVVERIRRVDANTLLYRFTIEDPTTWDRAWTGEYPWKATTERLFEYACHEGNYAMTNMLKGARLKEAEDSAKKPQ